MRRFLLWILMVTLLVLLLVGGVLGFLYWQTDEADLPAEQASLGSTALVPNGHDWSLPVMGGVLHRQFSDSPSLGAQDLGVVDQTGAALHLPAWAAQAEVILEKDGQELYHGDAEGYAAFGWPADGDYRIQITAAATDADTRPAKPLGWYSYSAKFNMQRTLSAVLSKTKLPQGSVFAIYVQGGPPSVEPVAECDLGRVWFAPYAAGWIGYLPAAYNAESGTYPLTVTVEDRVIPLEVEVTFREYDKTITEPAEPEAPGAAQEYRDKIWPLYSSGSAEKRWGGGAFTQPVKGSIVLDFGAYVYESSEDSRPGRSSGITFDAEPDSPVLSPADGRVVFSGPLLLTGNTVVVEHGCGVTSYFYHLGSADVFAGSTVTQGQTLGLVGDRPLIHELKIGNKSIDPWAAWKGTSGLFYQPRFAD